MKITDKNKMVKVEMTQEQAETLILNGTLLLVPEDLKLMAETMLIVDTNENTLKHIENLSQIDDPAIAAYASALATLMKGLIASCAEKVVAE